MKQAKVLASVDNTYDSMGLSLTPHVTSFRQPWYRGSQDNSAPSLCLYSTPECRAVCLVNTGQRKMETGAYARSFEYSKALQEDPAAFMRVFFSASIEAMLHAPRMVGGMRRFLRANVMSDLPWELLAPGFMEEVCAQARRFANEEFGIRWRSLKDGQAWYDYSKVPYRKTNRNIYDLTYSFMGHVPWFIDTVESGGRSAVVFVLRESDLRERAGEVPSYYKRDPGAALKAVARKVWAGKAGPVIPEEYYPWTFYDLPVWNGDMSDIRSLDPTDVSVVGLSYKPAMYKVGGLGVNREGKQKKFSLVPFIPSHELDERAARFLVRVIQPDPSAPPVVMPTQDPAHNRTLLPVLDS